jgi:cell wall-associated NlpC family hydrolase
MKLNWGGYIFAAVFFSCTKPKNSTLFETITKDSSSDNKINSYTVTQKTSDSPISFSDITTGNTTPSELVTFAISLEGTPYRYGSTDPMQGFDCSGFITYVFNHFGIRVPRRSVDFTFMQRQIDIKEARAGDIILFTGTDSTIRIVGHMGIVLSNHMDKLIFIHATSGKAYRVTETPLNSYYRGRYLKTIRVFPQNDRDQFIKP